MENFSGLAAPLTKLTKKNEKFVWSSECEQSFQDLKRVLTSAPVLALPASNGRFVIYNDASHKDLGCVLMHYRKVIF